MIFYCKIIVIFHRELYRFYTVISHTNLETTINKRNILHTNTCDTVIIQWTVLSLRYVCSRKMLRNASWAQQIHSNQTIESKLIDARNRLCNPPMKVSRIKIYGETDNPLPLAFFSSRCLYAKQNAAITNTYQEDDYVIRSGL